MANQRIPWTVGEKAYHLTNKKWGIVTHVTDAYCYLKYGGWTWSIPHNYLSRNAYKGQPEPLEALESIENEGVATTLPTPLTIAPRRR